MPRCDHAAIRVANLERSLEFYQQLLPARLVSRTAHEDRWRTEVATLEPLGQPDFRIVLLHARRVRWLLALFHRFVPRQTRSHEHLGFACDTLDELRRCEARARELGARIENPLTQLGEKDAWLLEVLDPDGNGVEWTFGPIHG